MVTPARDRDIDQAVARGSELLKQGNLEGAQKVFRAALALDDGNPRVLALLGLSYFKGSQFALARPIYEELVERAPTDASHRLNLGLVYLKLGDADKAIGALEASRALDPSQGRAVSYLGLAYARAGRYAEAYRSFLLAGQRELASEIEINLTAAERDGIHAQLARSGLEPVVPRERRVTQPSEPPPIRAAAAASGLGPRASAPEAEKKQPPPPPKPEPPKTEVVAAQAEPAKAEPAKPAPPVETASEAAIRVVGELDASRSSAVIELPSDEIEAPRMTDSLQFVLPTEPPAEAPQATDGRSMISAAVEAASATSAGATRAKAAEGAVAPIPLSQLATDELVRADDGDQPFEVTTSGTLVIRVTDRVLTRLDGVHVSGGDLAYEPATRRSRGHQTDDRFDYGGTQLHAVTGRGYLIALPGERTFTAVALDDDIFYLREDLVFAFEASLRWENGNVPGLRGRLPVVQFRGDGAVALRTRKPLVRVKLPAQGVVFVDATRLAGWIGRVIPRAVVPPADGPMGEVCVECTGEGVVLVDPIGDPGSLAMQRPANEPARAEPAAKERAKPPTPPPSGSHDLGKLLGDDDF